VVKLWDGVLAVPMIGTLDSSRTQMVMETLLQRIVETGSELAIIDITGVPTVDTLVAQHLLKTVTRHPPDGRGLHHQRHPAADRADHRAPGHRPAGHRTKATLADALALALQQTGWRVTRGPAEK
jgi:rsbT co-antagonist protein RsbR